MLNVKSCLSFLVTMAISPAAGCGGPGPDAQVDGGDQPDGSSSACASELPSWLWQTSSGAPNAIGHAIPNTAAELSFHGSFGPLGALDLRLYSGTAEFPSLPLGVPKGPIDLAAAHNTQPATCGACVRYYACRDCADPTSYSYYFASAGTLTITRLDTKLFAKLTDLTLTHVNANGTGTVTPASDGCVKTLAIGEIQADVVYASNDLDPRTLP